VLATVAWHATTLAAIGLLLGLPIGDALGRWAWNTFANQLGVVPVAVTPLPWLLAVVPCTIALASLVATIPGRIAARTQPALVLRAE
jgi:ABC-type lipoprotein release transport system permease subunit